MKALKLTIIFSFIFGFFGCVSTSEHKKLSESFEKATDEIVSLQDENNGYKNLFSAIRNEEQADLKSACKLSKSVVPVLSYFICKRYGLKLYASKLEQRNALVEKHNNLESFSEKKDLISVQIEEFDEELVRINEEYSLDVKGGKKKK